MNRRKLEGARLTKTSAFHLTAARLMLPQKVHESEGKTYDGPCWYNIIFEAPGTYPPIQNITLLSSVVLDPFRELPALLPNVDKVRPGL